MLMQSPSRHASLTGSPCLRAAGCSAAQRASAYDAMNQVLASLHTIVPADIGLEAYGKSQGYYARQVSFCHVYGP